MAATYETIEELIERVELSIPVNKNTRKILENTREDLHDYFKGLTQIRSQLGGVYVDENDVRHTEDIVFLIIYYKIEDFPDAEEVLAHIAERLIQSGEDECWVIYQNAKRIIFKSPEKSEGPSRK